MPAVATRVSFRRHPIRWARTTDPRIVDALFAGGLTLLALLSLLASEDAIPKGVLYRPNDALAVILTLTQTVPLAWRRRAPIAVLAVVGTATTAFSSFHYIPTPLGIGVVVAFYSAVTYSSR